MPEITRTQIITVEGVGQNSYGDLTFTDKEGKEYKVSAKRKQYFEKVIISGMAVQLNYSTAYNREYIYSATLVKDKLAVTPDKPIPPQTEKKSATEKLQPDHPLSKDEQIERAVWIKEWGECIRSGDIDKTTPEGKALRNAYYTEMCRVLGINIKEVQSAKSLIEEAKKMKIWNC